MTPAAIFNKLKQIFSFCQYLLFRQDQYVRYKLKELTVKCNSERPGPGIPEL